MAGYPVTIRLLDPPLHEFLPSLEDLLVETTELRLTQGERLAGVPRARTRCSRACGSCTNRIRCWVCACAGSGIVYPEIYAMQVRAIFEAACALRAAGVDARPDVMIPGVGNARRDAFHRQGGRAKSRTG